MNTQHPLDGAEATRASTPQEIREAVAGEIRAALARDGRRMTALATDSGISRAALSRKLRGLVPFYVEEILAIGEALHVDPTKFVAVVAEPVAA